MSPRYTILAVDDDAASRKMLTALVEQQGYAATTAVDGADALRVLAEERIDAVLLDSLMPGVDGIAVLQSIKGDRRLCHVPVIMVSAVDDRAAAIRCIELGADDYISEPFDPLLLRARIASCLVRKRFTDLQAEYHQITREQAADLAAVNRGLAQRVQEQLDEADRLGRLRRFLPPTLVDEVGSARGNGFLSPHRDSVAVLSWRIAGFDGLADAVDSTAATELLCAFHTVLRRLIAEFEATVGGFTGDSITVFFNDPEACRDHVTRALKMALALGREMAQPLAAHRPPIAYGAGIASGEVLIAELAFDGRHDYVAIGAAVGQADSLSALACAGNDVFITREARDSVGHIVDFTPVANFAVADAPDAFMRVTRLHA